MTDTLVSSPAPRKRRWLRLFTWILGVLIVLIVALYFAATSSICLKGIILPQVSKSLHADVTVEDASIHPFREITLRNLNVQPKGQQPIVTAPEVRVRYSLFDIIRGNLHVDDVTLVEPTVLLVENPDGSSNLDPILKAQKRKTPEKKPPGRSKPVRVDLRKLTLSNATIRREKLYPGNQRDFTELTKVNVTLENLKNGQTGRLTLSGSLQVAMNPPSPAVKGLLQASFKGAFDFALSSDLKPVSLQGQSELLVSRAEDALNDLAGFRASLNCALTPTDLKEAALRFQRNGEPLGELVVSGPFDVEKAEGHLKVELLSIDKRLLNLLGAKSGVDFGTTTMNSTNEVHLSNAGSTITTVGRFNINGLQLTRAQQTTPTLQLQAAYNVTLDSARSQALLHTLSLDGTENGAPLLHAELTTPMTVAWGNASNAGGDSSLNLKVTQLNLADWKPFLGNTAPAGQVSLNAHLLSQQGGQRLAFDLDSQIADFSTAVGSNQIAQVGMLLKAHGQAIDLKQFDLAECRVQFTHEGQPTLTVSGSGKYNLATRSAEMQVALQASLARLFRLLAQPDLAAASGTLELNAHVTQLPSTQSITGSLSVADFTGKFGENTFDRFGSAADLDVSKTAEQIKINRIAGKLTQGQNAGGSFNISGSYDLIGKSAALKASLTNFNQNGLRPFVEPVLADKKLVSIAVNADASAQYDPNGHSTIQAAIQVTNLVVSDPHQQFPATPLEAKLLVDTALQKQLVDVRQFQLALTPTPRARNQVQLQGRVDCSRTNAIQGNLKLAADSIEVTGYYDLFVGNKPAATKNTSPSREAAPAPAPDANHEPAARQLPFNNFMVQANIDRLYLHEVEISNLQSTVNLDGGHVLLKPCQLTFNGAPVNATVDLDLGVPGYKYALAFNADRVPLAPLMNTFEPERKGQLSGTLTAHAQINGAGTTGASLQKNLTGQFDVLSTNLNFSIANVRNKYVNTVLNVIVGIPDLIRNPTAVVGNFLGRLGGSAHSKQTGWADELTSAPIEVISARGSAGNGKIDLQDAAVRSAAFQASAKGTITLENVLTNSLLQVPVTVALSVSMAERLGLVTARPPAGVTYVPLPEFLKMQGTLGNPKAEVNKVALVQLAATTGAGIGRAIGNAAGGDVSKVVDRIGGVVTGAVPASNTNTPTTNQPPPRQSPVNNLLNRLLPK